MKDQIIDLLHRKLKLSKEKVDNLLEIPPNPKMGDYAFPCFVLSKKLRKNPNEIALELARDLSNKKISHIEKIESKGPYVNFFVNKNNLVKNILIHATKKDYGKGNSRKGKSIMVEFSQPNTHKAFHVAHIRGTSLGESLARIFEYQGSKVIRANYSGDTGMHIAKWIWCYQKYHSNEKLKNDESWIASIYVDAVKRIAKNEKDQEEVNEINKKLEDKSDKKLNDLWKKTRQLSIESWDEIYKDFGIKFDKHYFESDMEKRGKEISQNLLKNKIAKLSEGATIMDLKKYILGVWVLLRSDGTVLYSAKDIALVEKKLKDKKLDEYLVITADEQNLHFQQLLKTLELMDLKHNEKFLHLSYSLVKLPHGKMSSRTGDNILYSDFKNDLVTFSKKQITKKFNKISKKELEERALKIAMGAMKYTMLSQGSNKIIIFDKNEAINLEGDTGPYLQYSYARASSVIRKSKLKPKIKLPEELLNSEIKLIKKIAEFPNIVEKASKKLNPSGIANYSFQLAQSFNEFYHNSKVIGNENEEFRLAIIEAFRNTIKNSLYLLGIEVMEEM